MEAKKKVKSFIREFVAIVNGDDSTVQAEKALRGADSALSTHIAIATGDMVKFEDALELANDNLKKARVNNGNSITDRDLYIRNLIAAKNNVISAEDELADHKSKLAFLIEEKAQLTSED